MDNPPSSSPTSVRPGWGLPQPARIPRPTCAPAGLAVGITFIPWGIVTSLLITVVGLVVFAFSLALWIGEMRHERQKD